MARKLPPIDTASNGGHAERCDVFILGSGLAGSITGAILARNGAKVVLVDAAQHPRFAIGESMTPSSVDWLAVLKARFDVPEIGYLLSTKAVAENISPLHGRKKSFGFVKHEPGKEPNPDETNMLALPKTTSDSSHLFRQDSDQFYFNVANKYGCVTRQNWRAENLEFDEDGVTVTGQNGEVFRAQYLIDASGFRSPLVQKFDLREDPSRLKHHSRSLFTHYIGIRPFDEVSLHPEEKRPPHPWHGGTLHHVIERGWFWIIPFNNIEGSQNHMCSVGLVIDERRYPKPADMTPEEEFQSFLEQYPAVKRQFIGAKRVREWVSTDRLQYSSKRSVGNRWCLMSHASGFIDPLFSRGLPNTFEVVHSLCARVLESLKDGDWSMERYEYLERLEHGLIKYNDEIVNCCFISFNHYRLWNAVFRVWGSFLRPAAIRTRYPIVAYERDGDEEHFRQLENSPYPGMWWPSDDFKQLLDLTVETCEKYEVGSIEGDEAADIIFRALKDCETLNPALGWKDESVRLVCPTAKDELKYMYWANVKAPDPETREMSRFLLAGGLRALVRGQLPF
jgi:tetracycline 7-halogenase / FADH2 O2-dependent halogenase